MLPPDQPTAHQHWKAQEPALARKKRSKDRGLIAVQSTDDVQEIIQREAGGETVPVWRQRTVRNTDDPIARHVELIRCKTQRGMTADEVLARVEEPLEFVTHAFLYGEMPDHKRGDLALKVAKELHERQKEKARQNNIDRAHEQRELKQRVELHTKLQKMLADNSFDASQPGQEVKPGGAE